MRSNRNGPITFRKSEQKPYHTQDFSKSDFTRFLKLHKSLSDKTIEDHLRVMESFLNSRLPMDDFLLQIKKTKSVSTYRNCLGTLKIYFRDYLKKPDEVTGYKLPSRIFKPKILPSKADLRNFFNALPSTKYKAVFLLLASSGLRISELLNAEIDRNNRMLIPESHQGKTKNSWVSFYNREAESLLNDYVPMHKDTISHLFNDVSITTGININPHLFRSVFAREMAMAGVQPQYIDAFCGRIPQSVLARNYTDYSPEVLREIYFKASIKMAPHHRECSE